MKSFFLVITLIFFMSSSDAQKKFIFCKVEFINGYKQHPRISYGTLSYSSKLINDSSTLKKLEFVNTLDDEIDIINYMSKIGWDFDKVLAWGSYTLNRCLYFKKEIIE